jgi:DNA gyrase subunit A
VICHDPRCLPDPSKHPQTGPRLVQRLLGEEMETGDGNGHVHANGDGHPSGNGEVDGPALTPPPYGIALTAGGKTLRFSLASFAAVSTRKGRIVVRLDPGFKDDRVVGVFATDGSENVCLATRSARVLIFPVTEANIVAGAARGVVAIRLEPKDRVIGFVLANKKREGLTVRTNRGATQIVRATKYPVTARGGKGYAILQRGSLEALLPEEAEPIPSPEQVGEAGGESKGRPDDDSKTE